jgi:hypothetical protein
LRVWTRHSFDAPPRTSTEKMKPLAWRVALEAGSQMFGSLSAMTPNPSLHPTAYSGLRPLPSAGELKRWASQDAT